MTVTFNYKKKLYKIQVFQQDLKVNETVSPGLNIFMATSRRADDRGKTRELF